MKQIQVLKNPPTFILIPDDKDEEIAKVEWQKKYQRQILSDEQKKREAISIRQGKIMQRKNYQR